MNTRSLIATGLACAAVSAVAAFLSSAGPLSPPAGPITPTNKTLAEVEPRTAVNAVNTPGSASALFVISQPGSYYLTGNITGVTGKNGVLINASNVTLDLNGFTLVGVPGSLAGVSSIASNVAIRNGAARSWGSAGVSVTGLGSRALDLYADGNSSNGISLGTNATATRCASRGNGGSGVTTGSNAVITACSASNNTGNGFAVGGESVISGCTAASNGAIGISASTNASISQCVSRINGGIGINVGGRAHIEACVAEFNGDHGIQVIFDSIVLNNTCHNNGRDAAITDGAGVNIDGGDNRIEGNHVTSNDRGIATRIASNVIIRNTARSNGVGADFVVQAGDTVGQILTITAGSIVSSNPWANIIF